MSDSKPGVATSISVAMCTFNGSAYLREQLQSIAFQHRLPDELVVVDDGSEDDTVGVVERFSRKAPFPVRLSTNPERLGFARNFGRAIGLTRGGVVALCDQDDVWHPGKLARIEEVFARLPSAGVVWSDAELVDAQLRPLGRRLWEAVGLTPRRRREMRDGGAFSQLLCGYYVTGATLAFRSRFRELLLPIPDGVHHDGWIALLVSACAGVSTIPEPLVKYRQHGGNQLGMRYRRPWQNWEVQRRMKKQTICEILHRAAHVRERLARQDLTPGTRALLDQTIRHFSVRAALDERRLRRVPQVLGELAGGHYRGALGGLSPAVRDLVM